MTAQRPGSVAPIWAMCAGGALVLALSVTVPQYFSMREHGHSFVRLFAWQFGSWSVWALAGPMAFRVGAGLADGERRRAAKVLRAVVLGGMLTAIHLCVVSELAVWIRPLWPMPSAGFQVIFLSQYLTVLATDVAVYVLLLVGGAAFRAHSRAGQLEAEVARAELEALRLQIEPHFLFNTLNSIAALIRLKDDRRSLEMLIALSELLRATVNRPRENLVPLSAEVDLVRRYVDLQQIRFADRLVVDYCIDPACARLAVPAFLLQPLVENALRHGAAPRAATCHIQVGACTEDGAFRVWVRDDGVGLRSGFSLDRDAGTGLRNTRSRLAQLFGSTAGLTIESSVPAGTVVEVTLPVTLPPRLRATA